VAALDLNHRPKLERARILKLFPIEGGHGGPPLQYVPSQRIILIEALLPVVPRKVMLMR